VAAAIAALSGEHSAWTFTAMGFLHRLAALAPQLLCGWWFWRLSQHSGWGWTWALPACGLVALTWWLFQSELVLPTSPGSGQFRVGVGGNLWLLVPGVMLCLSAWRLLHSDRRWAAAHLPAW
jgi:hypothetical protein